MKRIFVISDTHLSRFTEFPTTLLAEAENSDLIIHAGDFCNSHVLHGLRNINKVIAVQGNMDEPELKDALPIKERFDIEGVQIGLTHGYGSPNKVVDNIKDMLTNVDILIFGHSHLPYNENRNGCILFNPGSCTEPRAAIIPTYGIINVENGLAKPQINQLNEVE